MNAAPLSLGVVADDFTGAGDIANTLVLGGMRTVLTIGAPRSDRDYGDAQALVVALKTRSIAAPDAVAQSLDALEALRARGARAFVFKYCSTFDSTDAGNIGPVAEALRERLDTAFTVHCPAFPATGRRVFAGYLFVGDVLLSESGMRDHPLNPMHDANLVRVLQRQTPRPVGRVDFATVRAGRPALARTLGTWDAERARHVIVDAVADDDLRAIGGAALDAGLPLLCGGSGIALGLPAALGVRPRGEDGAVAVPQSGPAAILAGSCSQATQAQIAYARERLPVFDLGAGSLDDPQRRVDEALQWADGALGERPILIAASAAPARVAENQRRYGVAGAGELVEGMLAAIARGLRRRGVARFVVAGGETSGAVVAGLHVDALRIGPQIDPGVPWTATLDERPVALALKSGNFGGEDFFVRAFAQSA
ncbi:MAG TPA: 3-oxo-tetronate kinase [Candidatus Sulfotelmatobacter sp.]|nr:3-oxo-tetronate kinase [Candidatus Sulfotelmatobacter sp.]